MSLAFAGADGGAAQDHYSRRRINLIWFLLFMNGLPYQKRLLPIPEAFGQMLAMSALGLALLLAICLNPRLVVRPNAFLGLLTLLAGEAFAMSVRLMVGWGAVVRSLRLLAFVVVLWLLTPWWGRRDLLLARCHLNALVVALSMVVAGLLSAPGMARPEGRLTGIIWFVPPTQVAQFAAVAGGVIVLLWMAGRMGGRRTFFGTVACVLVILLSHTRTALIGLTLGIICGAATLFAARKRVRRTAVRALLVAPLAAAALTSAFLTWFSRGQTSQQRTELTGRKKVWEALLAAPRGNLTRLFGRGLSNKRFDGKAIDNTWLAIFQDQGLVGIVLVGAMLAVVVYGVVTAPPGPRRALATFIVVYCCVASYTEVGLGDPSPYTLSLVVAASLVCVKRRADASPPRRETTHLKQRRPAGSSQPGTSVGV